MSLRGAVIGIIALGSAVPWRARGETIARGSFEEPGSLGDIAGTVQQIPYGGTVTNEPGRQNVRYLAGSAGAGLELGFATAWLTNANSAADGVGPITSSGDTSDLIGVTDLAPPGTNFADGSFGFMIEDADGEITLTFDAVDLSTRREQALSLDVFLASTTWETADYLRVSVSGTDTNAILFDTAGLDVDDLAIEGRWNHIDASLEGFDRAVLQIAFSSNASDERLWIDNIAFSGVAIPEPSSAMLLVAGALVIGPALRRMRFRLGICRDIVDSGPGPTGPHLCAPCHSSAS